MKTFDFEHEEFLKHRPHIQAFLRRVYQSGMTEQEFCQQYKQLEPTGTPPGYLKGVYQRLSKNYGFF